MRWIFILFLIFSCSHNNMEFNQENIANSNWNILENASTKNWDKITVLAKLGKPSKQFNHPQIKDGISWVYLNKKTGYQEWTFNFNSSSKVISVMYLPNDLTDAEFTIEKIMTRWKSFNCSHKKKKTLSPGLIRIKSYIGCENDKRVVKYNKYNEIESISVRN